MDGMASLTGRSAIVTGAASGIGLATVHRFAEPGASVMLVDVAEEALERARDQVHAAVSMARLEANVCDVGVEDRVRATVEQTLGVFGSVDIIVNNAGVMIIKPLEDHTEDDWKKVLGVDLLGAFFFTKHGFGRMRPGGAIVNVASVHAVETTPLVAAYAATKAALVALTHSASIEGKAKGIRANAVLPGAIDTPMLWNNPNIKSGLESVRRSEVGKPVDVASVIAFLASPAAEFVDGAAVLVDGGRLSHL